MRSVPLDEVPFVGALDLDRTASGVVPRRLPAWTRPQLADPQLDLMVAMPAGVRIELVTDATELELDVQLTLLTLTDEVRPAVFDLCVDGAIVDSASSASGAVIFYDAATGAIRIEDGAPTTIRLRRAEPTVGRVEVWLPHDAVVEVRAFRLTASASIGVPELRRRRWIHYGSSISHCLEAVRPTDTWPATAALLTDVDLLDLAVAGQCMLDQFVARTIRDTPADAVSLKLGINVVNGDTMRERTFRSALHGFLDTIRDGHPTTPVALVTPIACPMVEQRPGPTRLDPDRVIRPVPRPAELALGALDLERIRAIEAEVVDVRRSAGDDALHLVDGRQLLGPDEADDLDDGLHPTADAYVRIGRRFASLALQDGGPLAPR